MAKRGAKSTKKKRSKRYTGEEAAVKAPTRVVARVSVPDRNKLSQWAYDNKQNLKLKGIQAGMVGLLGTFAAIIYTLVT